MESNDESLDPRFCCFCQDAPPVGTILLVEKQTQNVIGRSQFRACHRCGPNYTDSLFGHNEQTGVIAVLQFEHDDFAKPEVQAMIEPLTRQVDDMVCHVCGAKIERDDPDQPSISARDFAVKMLRLSPDAETVIGTCGGCATAGRCSCCNEGG